MNLIIVHFVVLSVEWIAAEVLRRNRVLNHSHHKSEICGYFNACKSEEFIVFVVQLTFLTILILVWSENLLDKSLSKNLGGLVLKIIRK